MKFANTLFGAFVLTVFAEVAHAGKKKKERKSSKDSESEKKKKDKKKEDKKKSKDSEAAQTVDSLHFPAASLQFLKKKIDKSLFTWINEDEVKAGSQTCGFLTPRLGSLPDEPYPSIDVYFCMRFADIQPASKGYLVTHCGGPSSLSDCLMLYAIGEDNLKHYNIITLDQRGMGRSWPSFAHEECTYGVVRDENATFIRDPAALPDAWEANPTDDESIRAFLLNQKLRLAACWTCETCDFHLEAIDGTNKTYHFLDYSGTHQVVEDIERFRLAIGAEKFSVYGISYGTQIMSTYATAFPGSVDKFIADSNVTPMPDISHMGRTVASNMNQRIDYIVYTCSANNVLKPGSCPVDDLGLCMDNLSKMWNKLNTEGKTFGTTFSNLFSILIYGVSSLGDWNILLDLCEISENGDEEELLEWAFGPPAPPAEEGEFRFAGEEIRVYAGPTSEYDVFGNPDYAALMGGQGGSIPQHMVFGQSFSNGAYSDEFFIKQVKKINEEFDGLGTYDPSRSFMFWYGMGFYWPNAQPITPAGNPLQYGIVAGVLYDYATPYLWAQEMNQAFPTTVMITSQWITHGLIDVQDDEGRTFGNACQEIINEYLATGIVPAVDGTVCGSDIPSAFDIL